MSLYDQIPAGTRFRLENAVRDLIDRVVRGRCCHAPSEGEGGYHFWRCDRRIFHPGPHRSVNYLWGPGGSLYAPVKGARRLDRHPTLTRRQKRERQQFHSLRDAQRLQEEAEHKARIVRTEHRSRGAAVEREHFLREQPVERPTVLPLHRDRGAFPLRRQFDGPAGRPDDAA